MRSLLLVILLAGPLLVSSCQKEPPIDCTAANRDFYDCVNANPAVLRRGQLDLCIPYSDSLLIEGVWVTDFEWNLFHEDAGPPQVGDEVPNYKRYIDILPRLNGDALREIDTGGGAAIIRVRFEGRRPLCNPVLDFEQVLVDRVLSWEVLEAGPTNSITYGPDAETS